MSINQPFTGLVSSAESMQRTAAEVCRPVTTQEHRQRLWATECCETTNTVWHHD